MTEQSPAARWAVPAAVLLGGLAAFVAFYRLGAASWLSDELYYRDAAQSYATVDGFDCVFDQPSQSVGRCRRRIEWRWRSQT